MPGLALTKMVWIYIHFLYFLFSKSTSSGTVFWQVLFPTKQLHWQVQETLEGHRLHYSLALQKVLYEIILDHHSLHSLRTDYLCGRLFHKSKQGTDNIKTVPHWEGCFAFSNTEYARRQIFKRHVGIRCWNQNTLSKRVPQFQGF